MYKQSKELTFT